jgi:hypothetical protein
MAPCSDDDILPSASKSCEMLQQLRIPKHDDCECDNTARRHHLRNRFPLAAVRTRASGSGEVLTGLGRGQGGTGFHWDMT